jgi:hypothetical protein
VLPGFGQVTDPGRLTRSPQPVTRIEKPLEMIKGTSEFEFGPPVVMFQTAFVHGRFDAAIILWSVAGS